MHRSFAPTIILSSLLLATAGCAPGFDVIEGEAPEGYVAQKIHGGSAPTEWFHDAVVSLHQRQGNSVYTDPFCTGTLISAQHVLTAGHCLEGSSANKVAIYVGDNPYVDLGSHLYAVSDVEVHPYYNSRNVTDDIALITLAQPISESVTPVAPLPISEGLTNADIGDYMNFAGFGVTESGRAGEKLQVSIPLGGFGCSVYGCNGSGDAATQVSYRQGDGGPCSGDSGGPMFVARGSDVYVGGVTSYGDYYCTQYGVSTRADAYEGWISSYTGIDFSGGGSDGGGSDGGGSDGGGSDGGGSDGGGSTGSVCDGWDYGYDGNLGSTGDYDYQPDGNYFQTTSRQTLEGYLVGPSAADFDLSLYKWSGSSWRKMETSETSTSEEYISYSANPGYYVWKVYSYSGSGTYEFCQQGG